MAFDDLTDNQRQLAITLVEELASGNYSPEFVSANLGRGWYIGLEGVSGAPSREFDVFGETDLQALHDEGYITLSRRGSYYLGSLKPKAYEQFKLHKQPAVLPEKDAVLREDFQPVGFEENQLVRIEATSEELLEQLWQNYDLSRSQASSWFRWSLGVSVFGFFLLAVGGVLVFAKQTTPGIVNSVAGIVTEFIAGIFFRQVNSANQRQDQYHSDLLSRQRILDAVQLARLLSQGQDRDKVTETIIRQLLGIDQDKKADYPVTVAEGDLVIHSAIWGSGDTTVDVTDVLRSRVVEGTLRIRACNNELVGGDDNDPIIGVVKSLKVVYSHVGRIDCKIVPELGLLSLP